MAFYNPKRYSIHIIDIKRQAFYTIACFIVVASPFNSLRSLIERFRFDFLYHFRYLFPIFKQFDWLIG